MQGFEVTMLLRMMFLAVLAFALAMAWTPLLAYALYHFKLGKHVRNTGATPIFSQLHAAKQGTPTMGGILIWGTTLVITLFFWAVARFISPVFEPLNFLSRSETWLPLTALVAAAVVGLADDLLNVWKRGDAAGGLRMRHRLLLYSGIAAVGAWWFYVKLGWDSLRVPLLGDVFIGWWYVPFFFFVIVATAFSVNETDGLDGLSAGVVLILLGAYAAIAVVQGRYDLAAFTAVLMGSLLAFLWFNIFPARFFMGDTGSMPLGVVVGILAMLTNTALLLPIFGFILVIESGSVILQLTSRRLLGRKIFLSSPFHHHLEAIGWPEPKIVMRFWVISGVMCVLGFSLFLLDRALL